MSPNSAAYFLSFHVRINHRIRSQISLQKLGLQNDMGVKLIRHNWK